MRAILLASCATGIAAARAFMSDIVETVTIKGPNGALRVNKSDYDRDQADGGAKSMTLHKDEAEQSVGANISNTQPLPGNVMPVAAPSAPDFTSHDAAPPIIDPVRNAVAPVQPSPGQLLVSKEGTGAKTRYFVVDGTGNKVTDNPKVEVKGYVTDAEAWQAAVDAVPH